MNFHSVQSKFYYAFFKLLMSPPNSFVVSSLLSLKRSVFGTGLSKLMLQVWHHMALCGQSRDHAVASCDPQQQPGFKRNPKNNKSQSKPNTPNWREVVVVTRPVWKAPSSWRAHLPSEPESYKNGGRFDQESYEKSQEAHQEIAVSYWDTTSAARVKGLANINI